eukprot:3503219-Pyramimonas_sp.AAC.1
MALHVAVLCCVRRQVGARRPVPIFAADNCARHCVKSMGETCSFVLVFAAWCLHSQLSCGTCHSMPRQGVYQLASGSWYVNGIVIRSTNCKPDDGAVWPVAPKDLSLRAEEYERIQGEPGPGGAHASRKLPNRLHMKPASYHSPYISQDVSSMMRSTIGPATQPHPFDRFFVVRKAIH